METAHTLIIELPNRTRTICLKRAMTLTQIWSYLIYSQCNPLMLAMSNGIARATY